MSILFLHAGAFVLGILLALYGIGLTVAAFTPMLSIRSYLLMIAVGFGVGLLLLVVIFVVFHYVNV